MQHATELRRYVEKHASLLLRFETLDDLVQAIHLRALREEARFTYRSDKEFFGWMYKLARQSLADRRAYWQAMKRDSGRVLRLTFHGRDSMDVLTELLPPTTRPGPATFASRRELLVLAVKALDALPPRDRDLVRWASEDMPLEEQAAKLCVSYGAAQRAGLRAAERFRKTFRFFAGVDARPGPTS